MTVARSSPESTRAGRCSFCAHATRGGGSAIECAKGHGYGIDGNWGCDEFEEEAMTETEKRERIAKLREEANTLSRAQRVLYRCEYELRAVVADLEGFPIEAEWYRALGSETSTKEGRHAAYLRLQASRCLDGNLDGIPENERAEVAAEVERLKAERAAAGGDHAARP